MVTLQDFVHRCKSQRDEESLHVTRGGLEMKEFSKRIRTLGTGNDDDSDEISVCLMDFALIIQGTNDLAHI